MWLTSTAWRCSPIVDGAVDRALVHLQQGPGVANQAHYSTPCFETCRCRLCCTGKAGRAAALAFISACSLPPSAVRLIGSTLPSASPTPQSGPSCRRRAPGGPACGSRQDSWAVRQDECGTSCGARHGMQSCAWKERAQHSMAMACRFYFCEPAHSAAPQCSHAHNQQAPHQCRMELQACGASGVQLKHRCIHLPALGGWRLRRGLPAGGQARGGRTGSSMKRKRGLLDRPSAAHAALYAQPLANSTALPDHTLSYLPRTCRHAPACAASTAQCHC